MMNKIYHTCLTVLLLTVAASLEAQVTFGSTELPVQGANLDLKLKSPTDEDINNNNLVTSDKGGLVLPRVALENINKLFSVPDAEKKSHKGLIVYNAVKNDASGLKVGIYQWDGDKWVYMPVTGELAQPWYKVGTLEPSKLKTDDSYLMGNVVIGGNEIKTVNGENAKLTVSGGDLTVNSVTVGTGKLPSASENTALGYGVLSNTESSSKSNTGIGYTALQTNSTGSQNTSVGSNSLSMLGSGNNNTVIGHNAGTQTKGSNNLIIGANTEVYNPDGDNQINIGNLIYGAHGSVSGTDQTISYGKIGINKNNPEAMLDVNGKMFINDLPVLKKAQYPLVVDANGFIGRGLVTGTPTLNTLLKSDELHKIDWNGSANQTNFNNGNKLQLSFYDNTDATEIVSNTLLGLSANELTLKEDVVAEVSGYVFFQAAIYYNKFDNYSLGNNKYLDVSLILEVERSSGVSEVVTTGTQVWYGGSTGVTIKIIELQPAIVSLAAGDKLKWYIKKGTGSNSHAIDELPEGTEQAMSNIRPLAGSKISKTLSIVAFSK